jgi:hypothetical protein
MSSGAAQLKGLAPIVNKQRVKSPEGWSLFVGRPRISLWTKVCVEEYVSTRGSIFGQSRTNKTVRLTFPQTAKGPLLLGQR